MQWEGREESENVEDRRGLGSGTKAGIAIGGAGGLVLVILALIFGIDPRQLQAPNQGGGEAREEKREKDPAEERMAKFTRVILHDTEVVWDELFSKMGKTY